jgi:hypothetical protein
MPRIQQPTVLQEGAAALLLNNCDCLEQWGGGAASAQQSAVGRTAKPEGGQGIRSSLERVANLMFIVRSFIGVCYIDTYNKLDKVDDSCSTNI